MFLIYFFAYICAYLKVRTQIFIQTCRNTQNQTCILKSYANIQTLHIFYVDKLQR
jgi:hypothetical protein